MVCSAAVDRHMEFTHAAHTKMPLGKHSGTHAVPKRSMHTGQSVQENSALAVDIVLKQHDPHRPAPTLPTSRFGRTGGVPPTLQSFWRRCGDRSVPPTNNHANFGDGDHAMRSSEGSGGARKRMRPDAVRYRARPSVARRASTVYSEMLRVMLDCIERKQGVATAHAKTSVVMSSLPHNLCVYCMTNTANTVDHVVSIVQDGRLSGFGNTADNLVPCCSSCNSSKGSRKWDQWMLSKFGDNPITHDRIATVLMIIGQAQRRCYVQACDEESRAMYTALRERCYHVCSMLHNLSTACADDPTHWQNHVNAFDFAILEACAHTTTS